MGASQTKSTTNIKELNETNLGMTQETFNEIKNTCEQKTNQKNILNIIGSNVSKLTTDQKNAAKNTCILQTAIESSKEAKGQSDVMSAIRTSLEQQASAGIGLANAESSTNIEKQNRFNFNSVQRDVNEVITGCIMDVEQENVINIVGSTVIDSNLEQANDVLAECLSGAGAKLEQGAGAESKVVSQTTSETTQVAKGMDPFAFLASLGASGPVLIICCVLISIISSGMAALGGGGMPGIPGMPNIPGMPKLPGM
jgi:cell wall-associated NlpC family hydrolase